MSDTTTTPTLAERRLEAEVRKTEALALQAEMNLQARKSSRWNSREYLLDGPLNIENVVAMIGQLDDWRRIDRNSDVRKVRIVFNSYTHSIIQALAVHDYIRWLRLEGIHVTIEVAGHAAGQAAVAVAAADYKLITTRSWLSISEVSGSVEGNTYQAEEELAWVKRLQKQQRSLLRTSKVSTRQLEARSKLKYYHLDSAAATALGFIDGISTKRDQDMFQVHPIGGEPIPHGTLKERLIAAEIRKMEAEAQIEEMNRADRSGTAVRNGVVRYFGPVNTASAAQAKADLVDASRMSDSDITLTIDCNGGSCIDGFGFIDFARQVVESGRTINTEVLGYAASMGGVMLQLGKHRVMGKNAWLLIHRVSNWFHGTTSELELTIEHSMQIQRQCFELLASRSVFTADEVLEHCRTADWWITAEEALKWGFIDEIR